MKKYVLKRTLIAVVTVLVILFVLFLMLNLMPGSPFNNEEKMSPEQIQAMKEYYGLDKPVLERFVIYIANMLHGDFGVSYSIQVNMPISELVGSRLPVTLGLGLLAGVVGTLIGLVLGVVAALRRHTVWDTLTTVVAVVGISLPSFVVALILSYFLGYKWRLFPILFNATDPGLSLVLPVVALSLFTIASVARYTRSEMIEVMASDYMMLAESKGLSRGKLIATHALRNTLVSVITVLAPLLVSLMTGSLVIEKAFSIPGLGSLYIQAIQSNDYNVVLAISFIYSVIFIIAMLLVDVLYGVIDPRIRLAKEEG